MAAEAQKTATPISCRDLRAGGDSGGGLTATPIPVRSLYPTYQRYAFGNVCFLAPYIRIDQMPIMNLAGRHSCGASSLSQQLHPRPTDPPSNSEESNIYLSRFPCRTIQIPSFVGQPRSARHGAAAIRPGLRGFRECRLAEARSLREDTPSWLLVDRGLTNVLVKILEP